MNGAPASGGPSPNGSPRGLRVGLVCAYSVGVPGGVQGQVTKSNVIVGMGERPEEVAEALLNHVTGAGKNDLDEIYNRYDYLNEKYEALGKWEKKVTSLLELCASKL